MGDDRHLVVAALTGILLGAVVVMLLLRRAYRRFEADLVLIRANMEQLQARLGPQLARHQAERAFRPDESEL